MKINLTIEVTDQARAYLKVLYPELPGTTEHRITRAALAKHLQEYTLALGSDFRAINRRALTADEYQEAAAAVDYLRSLGKSDGEIRGWLLMQRARMHFTNKDLSAV